MQRRPLPRPRLGQDERAVLKVQCGESQFAGNLCPGRQPFQAAGDHQMDDEKEAAVEAEDDALADPANFNKFFSAELADAGLNCPEDERTDNTALEEVATEDSPLQRLDVDGDVGKFRQALPI